MGIQEANLIVFHRALDDLVERNPGLDLGTLELVVDGTEFREWRRLPFRAVPKADATVPECSAASIVAKTTRDAKVVAMARSNPAYAPYDLAQNKGYGVRKHNRALRACGRTREHRKSFKIPEW